MHVNIFKLWKFSTKEVMSSFFSLENFVELTNSS